MADAVIVVPAVIPVPDSESDTARTPDEHEAIVSVVPAIFPLQVAPWVTVSVVKFLVDGEGNFTIVFHIKSMPTLFNSWRVMSTPPEGGGLAPVVGLTVKPIGF
jgi:hypothetical protein